MFRPPATRTLVAALVLLALLPAGALAAPGGGNAPGSAGPAATDAFGGPGDTYAERPDPANDTLGWEGGYWHNETIEVDQTDGLSDAERAALVNRSMARVEYVRELEFRRPVPVSVQSRGEFEAGGNTSARLDAWNNQIWEALLIVGEDTDANELLDTLYGGSVAGFYDPASDEIVIVADDGEATVNNATLVHELTHALQDQYHNLSAPRYAGDTQDGDLGAQGIVEGEAGYVEAVYAQRCGAEWDCVPATGGSGAATPENLGLYLTVYQPYADGPAYVDALRERGGWEAVNETLVRPPNATEQTIHATDELPSPVPFTDTARNGWELYPELGENGSDTVGEASVFAGFWYQTQEYRAGVVEPGTLGRTSGSYDAYNYSDPASAGWAGDRVFPYRNAGFDQGGYVWVTRWDTALDARQFETAYRDVLSAHGAREVAPDTYRVPSGPFADTFHVRRVGARVRIVNGPTPGAVHDIRPSTEPEERAPDPAETTTALPSPGETMTDSPAAPAPAPSEGPTTGTESGPTPGFGAPAALAALALSALLARRLWR
jgi:PGF-CTERM protein